MRRILLVLYLALFLGLGIAAGFLFHDARVEYLQLLRAENLNRQRLAQAEAHLQEEEKILERLRNDPVYVETVIRRKLGYAKPDEFIFRFDSSDAGHN